MWAAIHYCILFESGLIIATDCDFYVCAFFNAHNPNKKNKKKEESKRLCKPKFLTIYIFFPIKILKPNK